MAEHVAEADMPAEFYDICLDDNEWVQEFAVEGHGLGALLVTVESIDGPAEFDAQVIVGPLPMAAAQGGAAIPPSATTAREVQVAAEARTQARVFADNLPETARSMMLRITGSIGRRFRVFVGWVRDRLPGTSCGRCKVIVRAALFALRAMVGAIGPDDIPAEVFDIIPDWGVLDFLERMLGPEAWDVLESVLRAARGVARIPAKIAEEVCRRLGFCP